MEQAPQVLVQGIADVDYRDLEANREPLHARVGREAAGSKELLPPEPVQRMFSFYFTRLYVHVRPERVYVWPEGDPTREPELFDAHMEEVRSGHDEEPESAARRRTRAAARLGRAPGRAGRQIPRGGAVAGRARRLPVQRAGADLASTGRAQRVRIGGRRPGRAGAARASPAWPRTPTDRGSSGRRTSRCAATSWRRTAAGRSCRTG